MAIYSRNYPIMCLTFLSSLKGVASDWFYFMLTRSLQKSEEVIKSFLTLYASRQKATRNNHHLLSVKMR